MTANGKLAIGLCLVTWLVGLVCGYELALFLQPDDSATVQAAIDSVEENPKEVFSFGERSTWFEPNDVRPIFTDEELINGLFDQLEPLLNKWLAERFKPENDLTNLATVDVDVDVDYATTATAIMQKNAAVPEEVKQEIIADYLRERFKQ